jgi:cobalamin biosynthesis protein CobC
MLEHGGNLTLAAQKYGIPLDSWLDLSTGINPDHYPIPAIPHHLWQRLPDEHDGLTEAACRYYGCVSVLPTAGSQAALQVLPKLRPPCKVAMPSTMYQEHAHAWLSQGHTVQFFADTPDADILSQADVVLVCNPNNPTGKRFTPASLLAWHSTLAERGGWLVVDEAFMDATPNDSIAAQAHLEGLFVLRSLGKFFGLAGLRVGFLVAKQQYLTAVQEIIGPWPMAGASRYIATQALLDTEWQHHTREALLNASKRLQLLLTQSGLSPQGGTALFHYIAGPHAQIMQDQLAKQGVWTRVFQAPAALRLGLPANHLPTNNRWRKLESALNQIVMPN